MTRLPTIAVLGGGGHASDIMGLVEDLWARDGKTFHAIVADDFWERRDRFADRDMELAPSVSAALEQNPDFFLSCVGFPEGRRKLADLALAKSIPPCAPLIHPGCYRGTFSEVGDGSAVLGFTWMSPRSRLGRHVYMSCHAIVGHDTIVEDFVSLMPRALVSGDCYVGEGALIGASATVLEGLKIGREAKVAAGAVVRKDVPDGAVVAGVPARRIR